MPKLSIIVPIFNAEIYLERCIKSILNQSFKDLELILINDGSTDNSLSICYKYKNLDKRIVVIDKENEGVSVARNYGLKIANGQYIGFVDSDDYIEFDMYEKLYKNLKKYNGDLIKCNYKECIDGHEIENKETSIISIYSKEESFKNYINEPYKYNKHFKSVMWDGLYKRSLFNQLQFPEGYIYEEGYILPKIFLRCKKLIHLDESLYIYVKNNNSITSRGWSDKKLKSLDDWKKMHFLIKEELPECGKLAAIKWIRKYMIWYYYIYNKDYVDKNNYYKKYIELELKKNIRYFISLGIDKKYIIQLKIFNFNPKIYIYLMDKGFIKSY